LHRRDEPKCCARETSLASWGIFETTAGGIKSRRRGAAGLSDEGELPARLRARAGCRRLSRRRLVSQLRPEVLERIIQEHLIGGKIVGEFRVREKSCLFSISHTEQCTAVVAILKDDYFDFDFFKLAYS